MCPLNLDEFVAERAAARRRASQAKAEQLGRPVAGLEAEDHGMEALEAAPPTPPLAFHIVYLDDHQHFSGRCVTLQAALREKADVRLTAYCHAREEPRAFLASRIVETTEIATGEVHADAVAHFQDHPLLRTVTDADFALLSPECRAIHAHRDEIVILFCLACADRDFSEREMDHIVRHVVTNTADVLDEAEVRRFIRLWVPDERAFERALNRMRLGEGDPHALLRSLRRVVEADGRVDPKEAAFIQEVQARLRHAGRLGPGIE